MGNIASISGVALVPGVSRNRRLYTPELIAKAAKRMQERIADPAGLPIVMRTHHEAGDDSAKIVGRVTDVTVGNDKTLRYKADLYDTSHARDIANLVTPKAPALRSVSIHGYWVGDTRQVQAQDGPATTADDLEIDAIDFTASPGVDGALIDSGGGGKATESGGVLRTPISEAMEAKVTLLEEGSGWADITQDVKEHRSMFKDVTYGADKTAVGEGKYSADDMKAMLAKGHAMKNDAGDPSYPIADVSDLKKAIRAVGRGGADHDAIRRHIIKRASALGQSDLIPDNWNSDGSMKENTTRFGEIREFYPDGPGNPSGFCIDAYSGPLSVTVRGCVSPDELRNAAQMAVCAAMDAINCMDPDQDADIDTGDDDDMGEQGTGFASGAIPDDDMKDEGSESAARKQVVVNVSGSALSEKELRDLVAKMMQDISSRTTSEAAPVTGVEGEPDAESDAVNGVEGTPAVEGAHMHTHDTSESDLSHTHGHLHMHESADGGYQHDHGHTHFHLPGTDEDHMHTHDHTHSSDTDDTHESTTKKESAMGDTQKAAEAAPNSVLTANDMKMLGETIGNTMAEALRAYVEMSTTPKHAAAAAQETTEKADEVVAESAVSATPKADDLVALKESLAKELRKEIRDELRAEILEEKGLPPRRGYRLNENAEEEVQLTDAELFDKHRVEMLLGAYAATPSPDAPAA